MLLPLLFHHRHQMLLMRCHHSRLRSYHCCLYW